MISTESKMLHKILANRIQTYIKKIIHRDQVSFLPEMKEWFTKESINIISHVSGLKDKNCGSAHRGTRLCSFLIAVGCRAFQTQTPAQERQNTAQERQDTAQERQNTVPGWVRNYSWNPDMAGNHEELRRRLGWWWSGDELLLGGGMRLSSV